jgi:hypothetical protein
VDQVDANDVLASKLIGMRIYAVESDIDDMQNYPADARKNWNDIGEVNDVVLNWDGRLKQSSWELVASSVSAKRMSP